MVVEIVEEETGLTGTLGVLLSAVTRTPPPRVTQDGSTDERIGSHVVKSKVLHQPNIIYSGVSSSSSASISLPDSLAMHRGLSLSSFLPQN